MDRLEDKADADLGGTAWLRANEALEVVEAVNKQTTDLVHKTCLGVVAGKFYEILENLGELNDRLRARKPESGPQVG